jgi:hypothetical protein
MSSLDYLDMLGMEPSGLECLQGVSGNTCTRTSGGSTDTAAVAWSGFPEEAVNLILNYTTKLNAWLKSAAEYTPGSRGLELEVLPAIPELLTTVAAGGALVATAPAAVPAVGTILVTQALLNVAGGQVGEYAKSLNPNSPQNLIKKAFLYQDESTESTELKSILGKALLYLQTGETEHKSGLIDGLADLKYNDEVVDFGSVRIHHKGKVIEY